PRARRSERSGPRVPGWIERSMGEASDPWGRSERSGRFDPRPTLPPMAGEPVVLVAVEGRVMTVTLNRPEARNALSRAVMCGLWDAVLAAGADPAVDAVIITGADPAFSAGVDLKEVSGEVPISAEPRGPGEGPERGANGLYRFIPVIDKPV